jgi:hypothetical protein
MYTYQQIRAIQEYRFPKRDTSHRVQRRKRGHPGPLSELLAELGGSLGRLGVKGEKGQDRPAAPAY